LILPATTGAVLFLCLLIFLALGSWILPWRLGAPKTRFEIFAIDFAIGAFLLALVTAFTLGSMGSELTFTDSLLVSGHRAQAFVMAAGLLTGIGNVALIASASLSGIAVGFSIAGAVGTTVFAWISGLRHPAHLIVGTILALCTIATVLATRRALPAAPRTKAGKKASPLDPGTKSVLLAVLSGVAFAGAAELARSGTYGELGVAPYAAFLFIALPALLSTLALTFFLFNFPLQGARLHGNAYFSTRMLKHVAGIVAGAVWGAGILGCFLLRSTNSEEITARTFAVYSAFGSFVLAAGLGLSLAAGSIRTRRGMVASATAVLALAVYFLGYAVAE
jgi:glucose uptake protein